MLQYRGRRGVKDLSDERLVFEVDDDTALGDFLVLRARRIKDGAGAGRAEAYWFPDQELKAGDLVVLYSKLGEAGRKENKRGGQTYFYYWGASEPLWTDPFMPVLIESAEWWISAAADEVEEPPNPR